MGLKHLKLKRTTTKLAPLDVRTAEPKSSRPNSQPEPTDRWLSAGRVEVDGLRNKL